MSTRGETHPGPPEAESCAESGFAREFTGNAEKNQAGMDFPNPTQRSCEVSRELFGFSVPSACSGAAKAVFRMKRIEKNRTETLQNSIPMISLQVRENTTNYES